MYSAPWVPHYQTHSCHSCQIPRPAGAAKTKNNLGVHPHLAGQSHSVLRAGGWSDAGCQGFCHPGFITPTLRPGLPAQKMHLLYSIRAKLSFFINSRTPLQICNNSNANVNSNANAQDHQTDSQQGLGRSVQCLLSPLPLVFETGGFDGMVSM